MSAKAMDFQDPSTLQCALIKNLISNPALSNQLLGNSKHPLDPSFRTCAWG
jgi:hypothetical protein